MKTASLIKQEKFMKQNQAVPYFIMLGRLQDLSPIQIRTIKYNIQYKDKTPMTLIYVGLNQALPNNPFVSVTIHRGNTSHMDLPFSPPTNDYIVALGVVMFANPALYTHAGTSGVHWCPWPRNLQL